MDEHKFDFVAWLTEHELNEIKECFTDCNMSTLDTLSLSNSNFVQLMADQRILSATHLIKNIVNGLQSLQKLRDLQNKSASDTERRLVFMTPREHNIFITIEDYIYCLNDLEYKLETTTNEQIQDRKQRNNADIDTYTTQNTLKLDEIRKKINQTTDKLHDILTEKEQILQDEVTKYRTNVKNIGETHTESVQNISYILSQCLSMIDQDIKYYAKSIEECKEIVSKYEEKEDESSAHANNYSLQRCNSDMRELEIVKIGNNATNYYNKNLILLNDNKQKINEYTDNKLILNMKPTYSVTIFNVIHDTISHHIHKLIQTRNVTQEAQDPQNKMERNAINEWSAIINEEETKIMDDKDNNRNKNDRNIKHSDQKEDVPDTHQQEPPPAAFSLLSNNFDISVLMDIEENKHTEKEAHSVPPPAIVKQVNSDADHKTPPPAYNANARKASKQMILQMEKSYSAKDAHKPRMIAMKKNKSEGRMLEGSETDSHAAYNKALANKRAKGKPSSFGQFWKCVVCTYAENPGTFLMCELCNSTRQLSLQRPHSLSDGDSPYLEQSNFKERKDSGSAKVEKNGAKKKVENVKKVENLKKEENVKKVDKEQDAKRARTQSQANNKKKKEKSKSRLWYVKKGKNKKKAAKKGNKVK